MVKTTRATTVTFAVYRGRCSLSFVEFYRQHKQLFLERLNITKIKTSFIPLSFISWSAQK